MNIYAKFGDSHFNKPLLKNESKKLPLQNKTIIQ